MKLIWQNLVDFEWFFHFLHHCEMTDVCEDALALLVFEISKPMRDQARKGVHLKEIKSWSIRLLLRQMNQESCRRRGRSCESRSGS